MTENSAPPPYSRPDGASGNPATAQRLEHARRRLAGIAAGGAVVLVTMAALAALGSPVRPAAIAIVLAAWLTLAVVPLLYLDIRATRKERSSSNPSGSRPTPAPAPRQQAVPGR